MTAEPAPKTWRDIADEQDGVLGRAQALGAGLTADAWQWQVEHHWSALGEGVAVTHTGEPTPSQLRWAAVVHGGKGAALDGDVALVQLGVKRLHLARHDISVPPARQVAPVRVQGFFLSPHRTLHVETWTSPVGGLPTVRIQLAALHATAWAPSDREAELRLCLVVQQRKATPPQLRSVLEKQTRLRRRALMRDVLDDLELGAHANSELDYLRFCRTHTLPLPDELQVLVRADGKRYVDARYRKQQVSVEVDGAHHLWVEQWDKDALRTFELLVAQGPGERVVRITQGNMRHDGPKLAGLLRQLLA